MLREDMGQQLISLISSIPRPKYIDIDYYNDKYFEFFKIQNAEVEHLLHFNDIVKVAIDINIRSSTIKDLISKMRSEINRGLFKDTSKKELDYFELFKIFIVKRKIELLRYLFKM